jgi:hypothetical protein
MLARTLLLSAAIQSLAMAPILLKAEDAKRAPSSQATPRTAAPQHAHLDHNPKHGGIFFMALNQKHHLEGVLVAPATFRVYLYDARTRPLSPAQVKQASGTVQWGEQENAPETPLHVSKDGKTLEATYPGAKLPITLTLLLRMPGAPPKAKPELFTFPFHQYTGSASEHQMPEHSMKGM